MPARHFFCFQQAIFCKIDFLDHLLGGLKEFFAFLCQDEAPGMPIKQRRIQ